jgi:F-type H+-transporting ATPase subunit a
MHISVAAEKIFTVFSWPVSNTMLTAWMVIVLFGAISYLATKKMKLIPLGIQNFFEWAIEAFFDLMNSVIEDREKTKKLFPIIATFFFFILATNWFGLLPGFGSIGFYEEVHGEEVLVPFLRSTNADLNTTIALAIISVISIQFFGIMALGAAKYGKKFFSFKSPIAFFVGILEFLSEFTKILSFSFRLFGSIFAGEVLLTAMAFLAPYFVPLPFMAVEVFIGFIQALVFSFLSLVFIKTATTDTAH